MSRDRLLGRLRRAAFWTAAGGLLIVALGLAAHFLIRAICGMEPPATAARDGRVTRPHAGLRVLGSSSVLERKGLLQVHLSGDPEAIGHAHVRLLYPEMVENEGILLSRFREAVPVGVFRELILDLAQVRYRALDQGMSRDRRVELAAGARAFDPDPYERVFPTFQRFVYLNGLYDIALSFEHSPLIGCTSFAFSGASIDGPGVTLARAFDFEVDPIFDRKKAVFFVREEGAIPFASVAWPGLVGVVSGMNLEGVAVVVHGGRAGEPRTRGEPVVHALRAVLSRSRNVDEALSELERRPPLVSHILVVADGHGRAVRVERVPGARDHVIPLADAAAVANHFLGAASADPRNQRVRASTSSVARQQRADELVKSVARPVAPEGAVRLLRDRRGPGGQPLKLGDRSAIDALIATHGVVFETAERKLWVSLGPHLLGEFVAFDLREMLAPGYAPDATRPLPTIAADPLLPEYPGLLAERRDDEAP